MTQPWRSVLLSCLFVSVAATAAAQPFAYPQWREGKHVYVVPEGFQPPMFGPDDLAELEVAARAAHHPFTVVITRELNGSSDEDTLADSAIDGLAQYWAEHAAGYDVARSQIFLLSYEPSMYRFLAGKYFTTAGGIDPDAFIEHNRLFERAMEGTPKDPKGGILALMRSVDAFLFDQTDPARIAARAEAARIAKERERLRNARGYLDHEIMVLERFLNSPKEYLPQDTSSYRDLLAKARQVRARDDAREMAEFGDTMVLSKVPLEKHIRAQRSEALVRKLTVVMKVVTGLAVFFALLTIFQLRRGRFRKLRGTFQKLEERLEERITNAGVKYYDFTEHRDAVAKLGEKPGRTKDLFDAVTAEVDDIYAAVQAMQTHLGRCKLLAAQATFFRFGPLHKAITDIEGEFTFDTKELNEGSLFGTETKVITVQLHKFAGDLEDRYAKCIDGWKRLRAATEQIGKTAKELFPSIHLDALLAVAAAKDIPLRWLHEHPLFGDDAADDAVYAALDALNASDPVAFADGLDALRQKEREVAERFHRVVDAADKIAIMRCGEPSKHGIVVDAADDPAITYATALAEDKSFRTMLASSDDVEAVEAQADKVCSLYGELAQEEGAIQNAVATVQTVMQAARTEQDGTEEAKVMVRNRIDVALAVHSNLNVQRTFLQGTAALREAGATLNDAERARAANRLLSAVRLATTARARAKDACASFAEAIAICDAADRKQREYQEMLADMNDRRESAVSRIRRYNGTASLEGFSAPSVSGPADYAMLIASLVTVQESWDRQARRAQQAYEEAERARRRREEEARRRAEAAAAARRAASRSSGSGFGGGGSSSRGGGFGGGGSSSRGGRW